MLTLVYSCKNFKKYFSLKWLLAVTIHQDDKTWYFLKFCLLCFYYLVNHISQVKNCLSLILFSEDNKRCVSPPPPNTRKIFSWKWYFLFSIKIILYIEIYRGMIQLYRNMLSSFTFLYLGNAEWLAIRMAD